MGQIEVLHCVLGKQETVRASFSTLYYVPILHVLVHVYTCTLYMYIHVHCTCTLRVYCTCTWLATCSGFSFDRVHEQKFQELQQLCMHTDLDA